MTNAASNQQLDPCGWCYKVPEARFVVDQVSALRCVNMACPVSHVGWISVFMWQTSRVSAGGVVATGDESGWLLEKMHNGNVHYIAADYVLEWTDDPNKALRLARREDAEALCTIVEDCEKIAEHGWPATASSAAPKEEAHERWAKLLANAISTAMPTLFPERGQDTYYVLSLESLNGLREIHREIAQRLWGPATTPSPDAAREAAKEIADTSYARHRDEKLIFRC